MQTQLLPQPAGLNSHIQTAPILATYTAPLGITNRITGQRFYELSNHLGNVLSTVSDNKLLAYEGTALPKYKAEVISYSDYYPFGWEMPGRGGSSEAYRYGFNGKEKDDEGEFGSQTNLDFGARIYNPAIGRWLSLDPQMKDLAGYSPYSFVLNSPLKLKDPDGKYPIITIKPNENGKGGTITLAATVFVTGHGATSDIASKAQSKFDEIFTGGKYVDEHGDNWNIELDVKFKYVESKNSGDFFLKSAKGELSENFERGKGHNVIFLSGEAHPTVKDSHARNLGPLEKGKGVPIGARADMHESDYSDAWTYVHETAHLFGLADRYHNHYHDGKRETEASDGFKSDVMGSYHGTEVNQKHYDNLGSTILEERKNNNSDSFPLRYYVDRDKNTGALKE